MLHTDPTEAIHSELILASPASYFDVLGRRDGGGGIAYEILRHNAALHALEPAADEPPMREGLAWDRQCATVAMGSLDACEADVSGTPAFEW